MHRPIRFRSEKVNYILVVGEQEAAAGAVNVNSREGATIGSMPLERFIAACHEEVQNKGRTAVGGGG